MRLRPRAVVEAEQADDNALQIGGYHDRADTAKEAFSAGMVDLKKGDTEGRASEWRTVSRALTINFGDRTIRKWSIQV
jgi:hypothetical protein